MISEVLREIFDCLDHGRELAVLARTCRAFTDPALDYLWEELPNYSILICSILPESKRDITRGNNGRTFMDIRGIPTRQEWNYDRYVYYATRVKSLGSNSRFRINKDVEELMVSRRALDVIVHTSPYKPILPALQTLTWHSRQEDAGQAIEYFIGTAKEFRELKIKYDGDGIEEVLSRFGSNVPAPRAMDIQCTSMVDRDLRDLCQLPKLVVLQLSIQSLKVTTPDAFSTREHHSPSLKYLALHSWKAQVDRMLGLLYNCHLHLEALKIDCEYDFIADEDGARAPPLLPSLEQLSISVAHATECLEILQYYSGFGRVPIFQLKVLEVHILRSRGWEPSHLSSFLTKHLFTLRTLYLLIPPSHLEDLVPQVLKGLPEIMHLEVYIVGASWRPTDGLLATLKEFCPGFQVAARKPHHWPDYNICLWITRTEVDSFPTLRGPDFYH